jgi:hypothetical protein
MNNIFVRSDIGNDNISGKVTYTNIRESIPEDHYSESITGWPNKYGCEWRWRFLKFSGRYVIEISYKKVNENRKYFDAHGQWIEAYVDPEFDHFVTEQYFVYT